MSNYNKVLLMGRLTKDPELRYTSQGRPVADLGLAVNREYTSGNERRKDTTFVDVTVWSRQAEIICQYLQKGAPLFVEGHLRMDNWETQDGQKRSKLRVVLDNFQFIGGPREAGREDSRPSSGADDYSTSYSNPEDGAPEVGEAAPTTRDSAGSAEGTGIEESDIPF